MSVSFSNQLTPNNLPTNARAIIDNNFVQSVSFASQGNTASTNALDLQQATPYPTTETINLKVIIGATTNTTNSGIITATLQESSDGSNFTNISAFAASLFTANQAGGGGVETTGTYKLHPNAKQYVRALFTSGANVGVPIGTGTAELLF